MLKQPKYFVSKTTTADVMDGTTLVKSTKPHAQFVIHLPQGIFQTKKLFLGVGGTTLTGLFILVLYSTGILHTLRLRPLPKILQQQTAGGVVIAHADFQDTQGLRFDVQKEDARKDIVRSFLARYKSTLTPYDRYAGALVDAADRYNLDYRLLPAIMMQESNLCKSADPSLHNCLGFGIHERGTLGFDTYEESFDRAARELKRNYIDQGLTTPEKIMHKYTPSSNGSWANSVNQWIAEMEHNDRDIGKTATDDANLLEYVKPT